MLLLLLNVIISEFAVVIDDYVYHRLGVNRGYFSMFLWLFPLLAAFIASFYSRKRKLISGLSYILVFPVLASMVHYLNGEFGGAVDFVEGSGIIVFFKVHLTISAIIITIGAFLGVAFSKGESG